jgi:hypothetical protein
MSTTRKRGRPTSGPTRARPRTVHVADGLWGWIEAAAQVDKISTSEFVRKACQVTLGSQERYMALVLPPDQVAAMFHAKAEPMPEGWHDHEDCDCAQCVTDCCGPCPHGPKPPPCVECGNTECPRWREFEGPI